MDKIDHNIQLFNSLKRNLLILLLLPVISIVLIYIVYGNIIDNFLIEEQIINKLHQLKTHIDIFNSNVVLIPLNPIPQIVFKIGYAATVFIYIIFFVWLIINLLSTYYKLSNRVGSKFLMLIELFIILGLYLIIINPGLNILLSVTGFLVIAFVMTIILMYWILVKNT
ncbi:MAG: hypothetical protein ACQERU_13215 [Bacteroidota bacterium]